MSLIKVISGGQSGVDLAALDAAQDAGFQTGGWMPKGFLTEDGPRPEYAERYGVQALPTADYRVRTAKNIAAAGATLILVAEETELYRGGTALTFRLGQQAAKDSAHVLCAVHLGHADAAENLRLFLRVLGRSPEPEPVSVLNVAGPRESKSPGIYAQARAFLAEAFRAVKE